MKECQASVTDSAHQLNQHCLCKTLNPHQLAERLSKDIQVQDIFATHPHLFSNTAVFISPKEFQQISTAISAIESVIQLPTYQTTVLASAPEIARLPTGVKGVFMGYDFHLTESGPKLIEINTNAGGAFLNTALLGAQTECCAMAEAFFPITQDAIEKDFLDMFYDEWRNFSEEPLKRIAIVDDTPEQQYLYPEFKLTKAMFERAGIEAVICDPQDLEFSNNTLLIDGKKIDLVYNRLTDFSLAAKEHQAIALAYRQQSTLVTPNPNTHVLYANKKNLTLLSDEKYLTELGVTQPIRDELREIIPHSVVVSQNNADQLWAERKHFFFKPLAGFGSRATYRGDKLTQKVWGEILQADYIAQALVPPSQRTILNQDCENQLKFDLRAYVYAGKLLMLAARLYQGQTTNFRTQGGGFAPVFVARE